jgi:predicted MFS family arabinose efflux permease
MLLFLLIGGVAVDRFSRPRIMITSDVARGAIVAGVAALAYWDRLEIWHIYIASLCFGLADAFFQPAFTALVPALTPPEHLSSANSLTSLSIQLGRVLGPAIGGVALGWLGSAGAFALNAASFFVSALCLIPLLRHAPPQLADESQKSNLLQDAREGLNIILASPVLWVSILLFAVTNLTLVGPYSIAMPFLVSDFLKAEADTLGLLYAIFPIGYIIGAVWVGRSVKLRHRGWLAYGGVIVAGLMLGLFGIRVPLFALILAALINGAALQIGSLIWTNLLQELAPNETLGRVASMDMLGSFVLLPIGLGLAGWLTDQIGPAPVFILGGGLTAILAGLALLHPALRHLD